VSDPIVDEIHRVREKRAAKFGHDIDAMFDDLQRSEKRSRARGVKFVSPKKLKPARTGRRVAAGSVK
jgi:hypothetical protein